MVKWMLPKEAAEYVRCSESKLIKLRYKRGGPRYSKPGGRVVYDVADLDRWLEQSKLDEPRRRGRAQQ